MLNKISFCSDVGGVCWVCGVLCLLTYNQVTLSWINSIFVSIKFFVQTSAIKDLKIKKSITKIVIFCKSIFLKWILKNNYIISQNSLNKINIEN